MPFVGPFFNFISEEIQLSLKDNKNKLRISKMSESLKEYQPVNGLKKEDKKKK